MKQTFPSGSPFLPSAVLLAALTFAFVDFAKIMSGFGATSFKTKSKIVGVYEAVLAFLAMCLLISFALFGLGQTLLSLFAA